MSAPEVAEKLLQEIEKEIYDVIIVNIVNGDMVGHTGVWDACIKAVKTVDESTKKIVEKILEKNGIAQIINPNNNIFTYLFIFYLHKYT
jgi:2,3-bisphosphoglycerate-independent phosphoglycerate mutase